MGIYRKGQPSTQKVEIDDEKEFITSAANDKASNVVNELGKLFKKFWMDVIDTKQNPDGSITYKMSFNITPEGDEDEETREMYFYLNGMPIKGTDKCNLSFKYPNPDTLDQEDMKEAKDAYKEVDNKRSTIVKKCTEFIEKTYKDAVTSIEDIPDDLTVPQKDTDASSAKKLKISLQKVQADTGYDIRLKKVYASYDAEEALSDIKTLVNDDNFVEEMQFDEPSVYDIVVTDDDMEVNDAPAEESAEMEHDFINWAYNQILDAAYRLYFDNKFFNYIAAGCKMNQIQCRCDGYSWRIEEIIDTVSRMTLEDKCVLMHPAYRTIQPKFNENKIDWDTFIELISEDIRNLINVLDLYSTNFGADKCQVIMGWIRSWRSELNYVLERSEEF